jgi:hypothetical protein
MIEYEHVKAAFESNDEVSITKANESLLKELRIRRRLDLSLLIINSIWRDASLETGKKTQTEIKTRFTHVTRVIKNPVVASKT